jgi:hypothetical protein
VDSDRSTLKSLQALTDNTAALQALTQQQADNFKAMYEVSQSQYGALAQAIAAVASGSIGGQVGLGFQTPGVAGSFANY